MSKYRILQYKIKDEEVEKFIWDNGTVFHQYKFLNSVGDNYVCHVVKRNTSDDIIGVLPLVKINKFGLKSYHIPSYTYQFGPIVCNKEGSKEREEVLDLLLNEIKDNKQIDFNLFIGDANLIPYKNANYTIEANQSHLLNCEKEYGIELLGKGKKRDLKKLLKLEEDNEIQIVENSNLITDHLFYLLKETATRAKFNPHIDILKKIIDSGINFYTNTVFDSDGKPLAATFCPFDKTTAYHLISASVRSETNILSSANSLSLFLAITYANKNKLHFDFEGSNMKGVANFYRSMGGKPVIVYRFQKTKSFYYNLLKEIKKNKS